MSKRSSRSKKSPAPPPSTKRAEKLKAKTFSYRATEPGRPLKPGIPIVVHGLSGRVPMYGLIDSGADVALFPRGIAASLGIDINKCRRETCDTAGGPAYQYVWDKGVEIEVQQVKVRFKTKASFSDGLPSRVVLLGREDFFSEFRVAIDERAKAFTLDPYM